MKAPSMSTRDLAWLVGVLALVLALGVERHRHRAEVARIEAEAREAIHGLAGEVWRSGGKVVPPSRFAPGTILPPRYDWKREGVLVPEWAEEGCEPPPRRRLDPSSGPPPPPTTEFPSRPAAPPESSDAGGSRAGLSRSGRFTVG